MNLKKKREINSKTKYLCAFLVIALFLSVCYFFLSSPSDADIADTWSNSGFLSVGQHLTVQNTDSSMSLLDSKDVLSADGLYYAAWTMGDSRPYENSEGETVDLYDAQLYLLLSDSKNSDDARMDMSKWLNAAKNNYDILTEEEISCNGLTYQLITYHCSGKDNPYDRGISAFCSWENTAMCAELTCLKEFDTDLRGILIHFLDSCSYE